MQPESTLIAVVFYGIHYNLWNDFDCKNLFTLPNGKVADILFTDPKENRQIVLGRLRSRLAALEMQAPCHHRFLNTPQPRLMGASTAPTSPKNIMIQVKNMCVGTKTAHSLEPAHALTRVLVCDLGHGCKAQIPVNSEQEARQRLAEFRAMNPEFQG